MCSQGEGCAVRVKGVQSKVRGVQSEGEGCIE